MSKTFNIGDIVVTTSSNRSYIEHSKIYKNYKGYKDPVGFIFKICDISSDYCRAEKGSNGVHSRNLRHATSEEIGAYNKGIFYINDIDWWDKLKIGDYIVSLWDKSPYRKPGDIFKVLKRERNSVWYQDDTSSSTKSSWRPATQEEIAIYRNNQNNPANISELKSKPEPTNNTDQEFEIGELVFVQDTNNWIKYGTIGKIVAKNNIAFDIGGITGCASLSEGNINIWSVPKAEISKATQDQLNDSSINPFYKTTKPDIAFIDEVGKEILVTDYPQVVHRKELRFYTHTGEQSYNNEPIDTNVWAYFKYREDAENWIKSMKTSGKSHIITESLPDTEKSTLILFPKKEQSKPLTINILNKTKINL